MMKKQLRVLILLFVVLLFTGCHAGTAKPSEPLCRVVTDIIISCGSDARHYSNPDSVESILMYLRKLDPYGQSSGDPTADTDSIYRITVNYSDGHQNVYQQKDDLFQDADGKWKNIDKAKAQGLQDLLNTLSPDAESPTL